MKGKYLAGSLNRLFPSSPFAIHWTLEPRFYFLRVTTIATINRPRFKPLDRNRFFSFVPFLIAHFLLQNSNFSSKCSTEEILLESVVDLSQENLLQSILPNLLLPSDSKANKDTLGEESSPGPTRSFLLSPGNGSQGRCASGLRRKSISESNLQKLGRSSTDIAMERFEPFVCWSPWFE